MGKDEGITRPQFFEKPIMSISEVAMLLDKSEVTIRRYVRQDEIPYRKRKRSTYFVTEEILEWVNEGD